MEFKEISFSSTPVKRIRFRGDSFQTENDPLLDNDDSEDTSGVRNGEIPRQRGLFTFVIGETRNHFLLNIFRPTKIRFVGLFASGAQPWVLSGS